MLTKKTSVDDRIVILGASRGLGWALYQEFLQRNMESYFLLSSRKILERKPDVSEKTILLSQDFSKTPLDHQFLVEIKNFKPTQIIYCAGGGPYGPFHKKKWSDHWWSLATTFLYPAELLHHLLSCFENWPNLQQVTFVGSAVAESEPDPLAASYAAAKHALKGLITTIQKENRLRPKILLFSPGYMQTDLLPATSWPKQQGLAQKAGDVAKELIAFIEKNNQR